MMRFHSYGEVEASSKKGRGSFRLANVSLTPGVVRLVYEILASSYSFHSCIGYSYARILDGKNAAAINKKVVPHGSALGIRGLSFCSALLLLS